MCDEMGFYVWEESHARDVPFDNKNFKEQITNSTKEMIEHHYNHPSIIIWGCLNECDSKTKKGREVYKYVINLIKENDCTRPVTFASNKGKEDICLDLVDIVSWNRYPGWYYGSIEEMEGDVNDMLKWLNGKFKKKKPVIISEFGAGAIYGFRTPDKIKWSEEYQKDLLENGLKVFLKKEQIIGVCIWQFADCKVSESWFYSRPKCINNKGIVDTYRRPKLSYQAVKNIYAKY